MCVVVVTKVYIYYSILNHAYVHLGGAQPKLDAAQLMLVRRAHIRQSLTRKLDAHVVRCAAYRYSAAATAQWNHPFAMLFSVCNIANFVI